MNYDIKHSVIAIALVLPLSGGCVGAPDDASVAPTAPTTEASGPDLAKPQLSGPGEKRMLGVGYVVTPHFTGPILAASNTLSIGGSTTLSISTDSDVGPTPYFIEIFDVTTASLLRACSYGTTCTTTPISQSAATTHTYLAYVSTYGTVMPPPNVVARSANTFVTWTSSGYTLSVPTALNCVASSLGQITATASIDVGPTPFFIEIFDQNGNLLKSCGYGTTCTVTYQCGAYGLNAFISNSSSSYPPTGIQASSNTVIPSVFVQ
jgi:hypothetical protein